MKAENIEWLKGLYGWIFTDTWTQTNVAIGCFQYMCIKKGWQQISSARVSSHRCVRCGYIHTQGAPFRRKSTLNDRRATSVDERYWENNHECRLNTLVRVSHPIFIHFFLSICISHFGFFSTANTEMCRNDNSWHTHHLVTLWCPRPLSKWW